MSSLVANYLKQYWREVNYEGYLLFSKFSLGDASETLTPKGLNKVSNIGLKPPLYIANYKGGRNESFMYGAFMNTKWYDYDHISAYTTAMAGAGSPDYKKVRMMTIEELNKIMTFYLITL